VEKDGCFKDELVRANLHLEDTGIIMACVDESGDCQEAGDIGWGVLSRRHWAFQNLFASDYTGAVCFKYDSILVMKA
jgi:hypothetical protein